MTDKLKGPLEVQDHLVVMQAVARALEEVKDTVPGVFVVRGLVLAAASLVVTAGASEEDFIEGCRETFRFVKGNAERGTGGHTDG